MTLARRRAAARFAASALATGLFTAGALTAAGSAAADENPQTPHDGGALATLGGLDIGAEVEYVSGGHHDRITGGLFTMNVQDGGTIQTYCIDFHTSTARNAHYKETGWESSTLADNPDAGKIQWILQNSFPVVSDLDQLAEESGAGHLTEDTAAAATQAAIWQLSDGIEAHPTDADGAKLTDWLLDNAQDIEEPSPSLTLSPNAVSGQPGQTVGPVTVHTTADSVTVVPDAAAAEQGVTLVDANGNLINEDTPVADGTELYFDVPADAADGTASLTATASSSVPVGRAFTGVDQRTQTMILAGSSEVSVSSTATATWAGQGQPSVAVDAQEVCAEGGVKVTATNNGDVPYTFELNGESTEVAPGASESILVPVEQGQEYDITVDNAVEGAEPFHFTGVLDCGADTGTPTPIDNQPSTDTTGGSGDDTDLAETGSSSNLPMITGIAVALLVVGGAGVFFVRRRSVNAGSNE